MKLILPFLKDNHNHAFTYASLCQSPNLIDVETKAEALKIIKGQGRPVNIILGWNDSRYHLDEDDLKGLPPSVVCNLSLHKYLIGSETKAILRGRNEEVIDNIDDQAWVERNLFRVIAFVANLNEINERDIDSFFKKLEGVGVWYAEDMLVSDVRTIRYYATSKYRDRTAIWTDLKTYKTLPNDLRKEVKGIKIFLDGAIGARTAAISADYISGGQGLLLYSDRDVVALLSSVAEMKKPVAIHAIGDKAIDQAAHALGDVGNDGKNLQARIEHCQLVSRKTAIAFKELGCTLSMQPNFSCESVQYADRLPARLLKFNNPFRMLVDEAGFEPGKDLIFGSDGMPHGVEFALKQALFPPCESQRLKLEEFIAGYCMPDMEKGSIEVEIDETNRAVEIKL